MTTLQTQPVDLIVIGSGAGGLTAAATARDLGLRVLVITKGAVRESATCLAQGGIAAVVPDDAPDASDSLYAHLNDTLTAGAGAADPTAAQSILADAHHAVRTLIERGMQFDRDPTLALARGREGGHSADRILHAGGDRTGAHLVDVLLHTVLAPASGDGSVVVRERCIVVDLLRDAHGAVIGAAYLTSIGKIEHVHAPAVLLATGGLGHVFRTTTNPTCATGDGYALALRAGAQLADMEAIQIHPTGLFRNGHSGQTPLITEGLRGAGARLVDATGHKVMIGIPQGDLAPRDVVTAQIVRRLATSPGGIADHVFLDATTIRPQQFQRQFPQVLRICGYLGLHPSFTPIPVAPTVHYSCGGIMTTVDGRCDEVPGLWAVGEVARTGLHGLNRLGGNSLIEAVVVGLRAAQDIHHELSNRTPTTARAASTDPRPIPHALVAPRGVVQAVMSQYVGVGRRARGLSQARKALVKAGAIRQIDSPRRAEDAHVTLTALAVIASAIARTESRGCHIRSDYSRPDADQAGRTVRVSLRGDGMPVVDTDQLLRSVG